MKEKPTDDKVREYVDTLKDLIHDMKSALDSAEELLEDTKDSIDNWEHAMENFESIADFLKDVDSMACNGIDDAESGQIVCKFAFDEQRKDD